MDYTISVEAEFEANNITPEKALLASMLARAILDTQSDDLNTFRGVRKWIYRIPKDLFKPPAWSFYWVCLHLNLDPEALKATLKRQKVNIDSLNKYRRLGRVPKDLLKLL